MPDIARLERSRTTPETTVRLQSLWTHSSNGGNTGSNPVGDAREIKYL
jgi:hypothetical protein